MNTQEALPGSIQGSYLTEVNVKALLILRTRDLNLKRKCYFFREILLENAEFWRKYSPHTDGGK